MAPSRKRSSIRARASASGSTATPRTSRAPDPSTSIFPLARQAAATPGTKERKRPKKHHALPARLGKTRAASSGIAKQLRRRRTGKNSTESKAKSEKLLSTMSSLADALPTSTDPGEGEAAASARNGGTGGGAAAGATKTVDIDGVKVRVSRPSKSLRSRPGAMKKRAKVESAEKERFARNLAVLAGLKGGDAVGMDGMEGGLGSEEKKLALHETQEAADLSARWKALRNYVKLTT